MLSEKKSFAVSKPELIALLLYVQGATGKTGEGIVGKTRLMKLVFLLLKEMGLEENMTQEPSFEPYRYGPFDAEVYDALDALEELGVIEEIPHRDMESGEEEMLEQYDAKTTFRLTEFGLSRVKDLARRVPKDVIERLVKAKIIYGKMPLMQLLHYVYSRYPEYARLSEANI